MSQPSKFDFVVDECYSEERKNACREYLLCSKLKKLFKSEINYNTQKIIAVKCNLTVYKLYKLTVEKPDKLTFYDLKKCIEIYETEGIFVCIKYVNKILTRY